MGLKRTRCTDDILECVNIWVYAVLKESPLHQKVVDKMIHGMEKVEGFLFSPLVASSFLRLVTNKKIFSHPSTIGEAWEFVDVLESHDGAHFCELDQTAFGTFKHLSFVSRAEGNFVPDATLRHSQYDMVAGLLPQIGVFKGILALR